jgi:hypothetical protein
MGIVYLARQESLDRLVAVKVIRPDLITSTEMTARFRREALASARLRHPNVLGIFDAGRQGETHYLVMEFIDGLNLEALVGEIGPLPYWSVCDVGVQVCLGLQHIADEGLVHRDMKPSNLLYSPSEAIIKIADLGLARIGLPAGGGSSTLTHDRLVFGTLDFIAPEQIENPHGVDIRSDLYGLGCTLYYALTGRVPFPGGGPVQKLDRHRWYWPTPPDELRPGTPPGLIRVLNRLMAKHPDDRYARPAEVAEDLVPLRATLPRPGPPESTAPSAPDPVRLTPRPAPTMAAPVLPPGIPGERLRLRGHAHYVLALAATPDGRYALSGGHDGPIFVWDLTDGRMTQCLQGHVGSVYHVGISRDGRTAHSGGEDRTVREWDLASGRECRRWQIPVEIDTLAVRPDGRIVLASGQGKVAVWEVGRPEPLMTLSGHTHQVVNSLRIVADGRLALSGSRDETVRLWDLADGREMACFPDQGGPAFAFDLAPDGQLVATGGYDGLIRLYDLPDGRLRASWNGHSSNVRGLAFSSDGHWLLSGANDQRVCVWDSESGRLCREFHGHSDSVTCVAWVGRNQAISGGNDHTIRVWQIPLPG